MEILELTALELGKKIKAGEITVKEAVQAAIDRAKEAEPVINSYVTLDEDGALAQAEEIQKKIDAGELTGPDLWRECRLQSRIICVSEDSLRPAAQRYFRISNPHILQRR